MREDIKQKEPKSYIHTYMYLYMYRNIPTHKKILKIRNEDSASEGTDPCTIFTIL